MCHSAQFGLVDYEEKDLISMPAGLMPFPWARRFLLVSRDEEWPFSWLQSLDDPGLAFVVFPLEMAFPDRAQEALRAGEVAGDDQPETHASVFGIVVLGKDPEALTVNLLAPVVVDWDAMTARQVVLDGPLELVRYRLAPVLGAMQELAVCANG